MPRKSNANNPLQMKLRVNNLPKNVSAKRFHQRLIQHIVQGDPLPSSWDVEIGWRNPNTKHGRTKRWQYDDFENAIADSREGFVNLVHAVLVRRLRRMV